MHKELTAIVVAIVALPSFAAEDKAEMTYITDWKGPYDQTIIRKYADLSDGVACYVLAPVSAPQSKICDRNGCAIQYPSGIGSISCVKVIDGKSSEASPKKPR